MGKDISIWALESLRIPSIHSRLTEEEKSLRRAIQNQIISKSEPATIAMAALSINMENSYAEKIAKSLIDKQVIVLSPENKVNFAYPISAIPTHHKVTLSDGRQFYAMCAIDAIGSSFTFEQNVDIVSKCHQCNKPIHIEVMSNRISFTDPPTVHALHVDLNKKRNWAGSS